MLISFCHIMIVHKHVDFDLQYQTYDRCNFSEAGRYPDCLHEDRLCILFPTDKDKNQSYQHCCSLQPSKHVVSMEKVSIDAIQQLLLLLRFQNIVAFAILHFIKQSKKEIRF